MGEIHPVGKSRGKESKKSKSHSNHTMYTRTILLFKKRTMPEVKIKVKKPP